MPASNLAINTTASYGQLDYQKYVEITDYTNYPQTSATYTGDDGLSAIQVWNKSAMLVSIVGASTLSGGGSNLGSVGVAASTSWGCLSTTTGIALNTFVSFPAIPARTITVMNNSGATFFVAHSGQAGAVPVFNSTSLNITLQSSTAEVALSAASAITVYGLWTNYA